MRYILFFSIILIVLVDLSAQNTDTIFIKDSKRVNIKSECDYYLVLQKTDSLIYNITERNNLDTLIATYAYKSEMPIYVSKANFFKLINANYLKLHGDFCEYENGELEIITQYNLGQQISEPTYFYNNIYSFDDVDIPPVFNYPENMQGIKVDTINLFRIYIQILIRHPDMDSRSKLSGDVLLSFIVNKSGQLDQIKIIRGKKEPLVNEVIRVVNSSPSWMPGIKDGEKVNVLFKLKISFFGSGSIVIGEWEK